MLSVSSVDFMRILEGFYFCAECDVTGLKLAEEMLGSKLIHRIADRSMCDSLIVYLNRLEIRFRNSSSNLHFTLDPFYLEDFPEES